MKVNDPSGIKLVFTAATEKELPMSWLKEQGYPVLSCRGVVSGGLSAVARDYPHRSILFLITGIGPERSSRAAEIIARHIRPLAVVNLGSCGMNAPDNRAQPGQAIYPRFTRDESGHEYRCLSLPPFPVPDERDLRKVRDVQSLTRPLLTNRASYSRFVDMEACYQHGVLCSHCIRFCTIKVVTDFCSSSTSCHYGENLRLVKSMLKDILTFLEQPPATAPDISVIIPVFNRAGSIKGAVDSVLSQDLPPGEIIVVDDGSEDETCRLLRDYGQRIKVVSLEKNQGVSTARNRGIQAAAGSWVAFLDSDDRWMKGRLLHQVSYLERNPFLEILQCDEIWIRNGKRVNKRRYHEKREGWLWNISLERCMVSPSCVILRKALIEKYGLFDTEMPACEDYDLWLRISRNHPVGLNAQADVNRYGGHGDQLSARYPAMDRFRVYAMIKAMETENDPLHAAQLRDAVISRLSILAGGARKRHLRDDLSAYLELSEKVKNGNVKCRECGFLLRK